jgi:23S rRNA pseudouridine1911/1915/1917 synthase
MVVAKNDRAHKGLAAQFADHGRTGPLQRAYLAIVWGAPEQNSGTIVANLARSARNREKMAIVREGGREAITHYERREIYGPREKPIASAVECQLETGRTHQIRVHMASIGHPVIGDRTYGSGFLTKAATLPEPARSVVAAFPRQALHAWLLGFAHPRTGEEMTFESEPPADMQALMAALESLKS